MSVIVTNAKNRISYGIVRSLGQRGIPVYTSDFVPVSMSFTSRYSKGHFIYPSPFRDQEAFIRCILKKVKELKPDVLIPVFEETYLIAKYKDQISKHVKMVIPDYQQILTAHNKDRWIPLAKRLHIPVPKSLNLNEILFDKKTIKRLRYPVLIKPKQGGGAWGITSINSPEEFESLFNGQSLYGHYAPERFLVQEKMEGKVYCAAMLFNEGKLRGRVIYKQLRDYPVSGGQATLRVSVNHSQVEDYFKTLLEELNWHGICQADFLINDKTGVPHLIDINPRLWGSLMQGIASGVDFPYLIYKIAKNGDVDPVREFKTGVKTRWIWGDLRTFPQALKQSHKKLKFLKEYFFSSNAKVLNDDFCLKDPLPFFTFGLDALIKMIKQRTLHPGSHDSLEGIWE